MPDFEVPDVDGGVVASGQLLGAPHVLAFMAVGCTTCREQLPDLVAFAGAVEADRGRIVAVVDGDPEGAAAYVEQLAPVAQVVSGRHAFELSNLLSISALPTYLVVDEHGVVVSNGSAIAELDPRSFAPVPAPTGGLQ